MTPTMNNHATTPKGVCFLGAGASVWAGAPTFSNFRRRTEEVYNKLPDISPEKEIFKRVLKHWEDDYNTSNIEEYYAAIEMLETLKFNSIKTDSDCITADNIVYVICTTIQKSIANYRKQNFYNHLTVILEDEIPDFIFITTNWDILLESTMDFRDGWVNYGGIPAYDNPSGQTEPNREYSILKLHGSLNWGFCKECGKIYYTDKTKCDILTSYEGLRCGKCQTKLEPAIIPPTSSKLAKAGANSKYAPLLPIWRSAFEHLKLCEKIYFIGYSLPETDIETKIFISNALKENSNLKEVVIISDQKYGYSRVDFEERYHSIISRIISNPKVKFIDEGFEEFCQKHPAIHRRSLSHL
ncbi:Uncharacterised protein [uncultured archaeon]|nr:Uncharacterised protein [uncultured archaeon]